MKLVCMSDTHRDYAKVKVPDGDVLIHAGDIDIWGYENELVAFNEWLGALPHKHKIIIAGNHDKLLQMYHKENIINHLSNAIYLENDSCTIDGVKFWGSPVTPRFGEWFFMHDRGTDIQTIWDMIPTDVDVIITHGPPYGIGDAVSFPTCEHVGCSNLLKTVKNIKPKVHVFGHIHSGHGITISNDIKFVNASVMDEEYTLAYEPIQVTI